MTAVGIVGHLARDTVEGAAPRVGGTVYYGARAAAVLGLDARVAARCGRADKDALLPPLELLGLPTTWRPSKATTAFSFRYEGDRRLMTVDSVGDPWSATEIADWVADAIGDASWVQVGALLRSDFGRPALAALASGGRRLLVDGQGLVRLARRGPLALDDDVDTGLLAELTVLKLSENEARALAGGLEPELLRALGVPEVIVTLGSRGSSVVTSETEVHITAVPATAVRDPTGAGDAYSTAYLAARAGGADPKAAAEHASGFVAELLSSP
jgi:sugar/nucleoside kinase (ribokinase family)